MQAPCHDLVVFLLTDSAGDTIKVCRGHTEAARAMIDGGTVAPLAVEAARSVLTP